MKLLIAEFAGRDSQIPKKNDVWESDGIFAKVWLRFGEQKKNTGTPGALI